MGCIVRLLYDDTFSKSPDFEMDLLNSLDLRCGTLKGGKGGSLFRERRVLEYPLAAGKGRL